MAVHNPIPSPPSLSPPLPPLAAGVSTALYFGYMAMAAWVFFLLTGSIGFVSTLFFVTKVFSVVKVD